MPHPTKNTVTGRKLLLWLLVLFIAAVVPGVIGPTLLCRRDDPKLDVIGDVGHFAMIDERGQPFTEDAFRGQVTLVNFIFTRCDTLCPITTMKMQRLQEKTFDLRAHIKLASFSVDPGYDTPARLAEYAQRYKADPERWRFVTGPVEPMRALIEGPFMNSMAVEGVQVSGGPAISHSGFFLLVDPRGQIRGAYDSGDIQRLDEMVRDARFLVRTGG